MACRPGRVEDLERGWDAINESATLPGRVPLAHIPGVLDTLAKGFDPAGVSPDSQYGLCILLGRYPLAFAL